MSGATVTVLYAGAEAPDPGALSADTGVPVVTGPRALAPFLEQARSQDATLVLIPAGTDRDLTSVTQAAQALQWAQRSGVRVVLGPSLIDATRAIAELRRHLRAVAPDHDGVLFVARTVDPFADAELVRRVRLARQFSEDLEVEVAFEGSWPSPDTARDRLRALGAAQVAEIRADLALGEDAGTAEPLFRPSALATAAQRAAHTAVHLAEDHHDDGIAAGLLADHGTGFAHSHGDEDGHSHTHTHSHGHSHGHSHTHHH
jgi:sirohydrochlorin cobaltochelatase